MTRSIRKSVATLVPVVIGAVLGAMSVHFINVNAGELDPTDPPGPTMKTLDEVEPRIPIPASPTAAAVFVISNPGSYYLAGDRNASGNGIEVNADNVTIDLMGYSLIGPGKTSGTNHGIYMSGRRNVEIRNGTVREFGANGIYEDTAGASRKHRVVRVCAISNGGTGIYLAGYGGFIKECTALENGAAGIFTDSSSIVMGNSCIGNGHNGLQTGHSCTIINNNARDNTNSFGIYAYHGCTVIGNTMQGNKSGANVGQGSTVVANTARGNTEVGIACWSDCLIDQNTAYNNGTANMTASGCTLGVNHAP